MKKTLKNQLFMWRLCFRTAPGFMIYWLYDGVRLDFFIFLEHVIGIRYVLECAEFGKPFSHVAWFMAGLVGLIFLQIFFDGYFIHNMSIKYKPRLYQALKEQLYQKAVSLDLTCYDDPDYYNEFVLAVSESDRCVDRFLTLLNTIMSSITIVFTTGIFFLVTDMAGIGFVALSLILTLAFSGKLNKLNFKARKEINPHERKRNYIQRVCYLNDYAKELRLNPQIADILTEDFDEANDKIIESQKKYAKKRFGFSFLRNYVASDFITDGLYITYLVFKAAVLKSLSYSNAVVLFNSTNKLRNGLRKFAEIGPAASENSMYIEKIQEFLSSEPKIERNGGATIPEEPQSIIFENVSFAYKEKDGAVLKNINLTIQPGEHIALVGYNGSGKTTLIKLLMRLYDPTEGRILYGGKDIREYDVTQYRKKMGVIFQDFKMYGASLKENVVLDDLTKVKVADEDVTAALKASGFMEKLDDLPTGLDTPITAEFEEEGINLSGGESQKVAIARVFYQNADIIIMDEPSSALDPIAEYGLNQAMSKAARDKTVVYISHRLSTTRGSDHIYMLENGKIIEEGTHGKLLEKDGQYAQMWNAQAGRYQSKTAG